MSQIRNPLINAQHEALSGPYDKAPSSEGVRPTRPVIDLVRSQVEALLLASPAYHSLDEGQRTKIAADMSKIAAYSAALVQEEFALSKQLGQTPVLHQQLIVEQPLARPLAAPSRALSNADPASDEFSPRAASQVAQITRETLNAIAFPTFVADLIKGTFQAIVESSIQQMQAYGELLANVAKTVDQFMADNVTDNQARDYLASNYPGHFRVDTSSDAPRLRVRQNASDLPAPSLRQDFALSEDVDLDDDAAEETLVPAARRKMAQNRHSMLATMVMMGINRIVVTSGNIRAKMGFRIDASDTGRSASARDFDFKNETTASYGGGVAGWLHGGPEFKSKNTVAYVSSTKKDSSDELNVEADLTGEVDLKFKSDYFPMSRFAEPGMIALIQGNTYNPTANTPNTQASPEGPAPAPARAPATA